ncbi:MBL fold metallo-hydrolase [Tropicimonas isoalkanivorans]|uniref:Glyoxylase, beta-lactamase superfamily II n=1 Tax=Tropicimonas isoalkanivorans TaxID=441112 RepID=A0A1I1JM74_9RHOB|nr:MBL fold metallo-hydrolase [Tropicimonas isoalkanivorans]SFC49475.1 Glyoxylase, beta-lactamase superfamily II [Tropicimonas isoalkanivorans]
MELTRRGMLKGALAVAAAGTFGLRAGWSRAAIDLGEATVEVLSDGHLTLPADFIFAPMPPDELGAVLEPYGIGPNAPLTPECNVTLLRKDDMVVLFDAGAGSTFQDTAGKIAEALDAAGLAPEDVTHVVFTHGHPDHLWGVLDDFDEPFFSEAQHLFGKAERDYWMDPNTVDSIGAGRTAFAVGAQRRLEAMEDAMTFFSDGEEILPGVAAYMTPGHTPGHMSFEIRSGNESLLVIGDAISNHHVAFARPDWPSGSDQDESMAAATRVALMDRLASEQMRFVGFHLPGGFGRAERDGSFYRFVEGEG